jgi:glycosyltransferase involved in cell wall biosynthesis
VKVLHIIPRWIGGGPERHLIELARQDRLVDANVERRALVLDRPLSAPLMIKARKLGLTIVADPWADVVRTEVATADVVEITYWNHPALIELLISPLPGARIIIRSAVAGDTLPQVLISQLTDYADAWQLGTPPGYGARHIERTHPWVVFIPALAEIERLENFRRRKHDGTRAAYLGNLTPSKIHPKFAEIVAMLDSHILVDLIGDGDEVSTGSLHRRFEELGVSKRVSFHGHVESIADSLADSDIFIYPLNPESYGTSEKALQEAMWLGLPPVLMAGTAAAGWIDHGRTGFVASDLDEFVRYVNRLAQDENQRLEIGSAAAGFAREHFDPARGAQKIRDLHGRLMTVPKRTRLPLQTGESSGAEKFHTALGLNRASFLQRLEQAPYFSPASNFMLLKGEGGLLHYQRHYPDDADLRAWSSLLSRVSQEG